MEVCWAVGLKYSQGFTKFVPSIITILGMIGSFYFLSVALKTLPLGTAYAIWTGIGTVILGIILFKEPVDIIRIVCIILIIIGILGLKIISKN